VQHRGAVGQLRDHVGPHEARDLQAPQPGAPERLDEPHLVGGGDHLGLVLEAVARPDLANAHGLGELAHRAKHRMRAMSDYELAHAYDTVNLLRRGGAVKIELNRPDRLNAWNRQFGYDLDRKSTRLNSSHDQISYA